MRAKQPAKETRTDDFVTDELRFYMRREGTMYSVSLSCLKLNCLHCTAKGGAHPLHPSPRSATGIRLSVVISYNK